MQKYHIIYADPPWQYDNKNPHGIGGTGFGAEKHYTTMSLESLKKLNVSDIAENDAALFIWMVPPLLPYAMEVISAWGFVYKTVAFVWIKLDSNGSPFFGVGSYTKSNCEICLLATRGKINKKMKGIKKESQLSVHSNHESQIITTTRRNKAQSGIFHSMKPDQAYGKIERLFGDTSRIELFARRKRQGWHAWGNQIESDIKLEISK